MIGRKWRVSEGSAVNNVSLLCVLIQFQPFLILHEKVRIWEILFKGLLHAGKRKVGNGSDKIIECVC